VKAVIALVRRAAAFELALYRSLFRWVTRRPYVPSGAAPFAHVGAVAAIHWVFVSVSAIELVALHLLLPWESVRIVVDILSAWGLVWMLGMLASFKVYPHLVTESGIRVRRGVSTDLTVPWDAIATIGMRERSRDKSRALQLDRTDDGSVLNVVMASRTNVDLTLRRPLVVPLRGRAESVTALRLYADDSRGLVSRVRERLRSTEDTHR
jgi:hypothetical protein